MYGESYELSLKQVKELIRRQNRKERMIAAAPHSCAH